MWERGLCIDGMRGSITPEIQQKRLEKGEELLNNELDAPARLQSCYDFQTERSIIQELVESYGHLYILNLQSVIQNQQALELNIRGGRLNGTFESTMILIIKT